MAKARVFQSGNSQAVRLPKEFRVLARELEIYRRGDEIVLREPKPEVGLGRAFSLLSNLPFDNGEERLDEAPQERDGA